MLPGFPGGPQFDWVTDMARSGPPNSTKFEWRRGAHKCRTIMMKRERDTTSGASGHLISTNGEKTTHRPRPKARKRERETFIRLLVFYSVADFIQSVITKVPLGSNSASWVLCFFDHSRDALHATMQIASWIGSVRIHGICQPPTKPRRREGSGKTLQL